MMMMIDYTGLAPMGLGVIRSEVEFSGPECLKSGSHFTNGHFDGSDSKSKRKVLFPVADSIANVVCSL